MLFMRAPNNVLFTAATALFDEHLFPKCDKKQKVPPVTQIQQPEESSVEIEIEDVADDDEDLDPSPAFLLPKGEDRLRDDTDHPIPPQSPPPDDAPGGAPGGSRPRQSGRPRRQPHKEGNVYPPGTSTDTDCHRKLHYVDTIGSATMV